MVEQQKAENICRKFNLIISYYPICQMKYSPMPFAHTNKKEWKTFLARNLGQSIFYRLFLS